MNFLAKGHGVIKKIVSYQRFGLKNYNLSFGDWNEALQVMDDSTRTNNLDRNKVMATVASTVLAFIEYHQGCVVFATGSTASRTRLYQMGIRAYRHLINKDFISWACITAHGSLLHLGKITRHSHWKPKGFFKFELIHNRCYGSTQKYI